MVTAIHIAPASRLPCVPSSPCTSTPALASSVTATTAPSTGTSPSSPRRARRRHRGSRQPRRAGRNPTHITIFRWRGAHDPGARLRIGDVDLEVVRAAALQAARRRHRQRRPHRAAGGPAPSAGHSPQGSIAVGDPVPSRFAAGPAVDSAEHGYRSVVHGFDDVDVSDGDVVAPALIREGDGGRAGVLRRCDPGVRGRRGPRTSRTVVRPGASGTSTTTVTSVRSGRPATASYDLRWMVEDGAIVGLRFTEAPPRLVRRSLPGLIVAATAPGRVGQQPGELVLAAYRGLAGERVHDIACSASPGWRPRPA